MTNSKKRCTYCKEYRPFESMINVPAGKFCCKDHLYRYATERTSALLKKSRTITKKKHAKEKQDYYDNDLKHQHKTTQLAFNKLRKLQEFKWFKDRGLEPECISCGKISMDWCCGHLKTVGSSGSHRYSEDNTKLQCNRYCNMGLSGNINGNKTTRGYLQGLVDRFGSVEAKRITESLTDSVKKWTCEELIKMRKEFNSKLKELKQ